MKVPERLLRGPEPSPLSARVIQAVAAGFDALGLSLLPPPAERLWTLNAVFVPEGVDEAAVRRRPLDEFSIEIGAGLVRVLRASGRRAGSESAALGGAETVLAAV